MTILHLPWPPKALHSNARCHWAAKHRATTAYRQEAAWVARMAGVKPEPMAVLEFTFHPPDRRRRDAQNMPAAMKAPIDGIADAMGCDDHGFRCLFPAGFGDPVKGGAVVVHVSAPVELRGAIS